MAAFSRDPLGRRTHVDHGWATRVLGDRKICWRLAYDDVRFLAGTLNVLPEDMASLCSEVLDRYVQSGKIQ